jgi:hypothetical protein
MDEEFTFRHDKLNAIQRTMDIVRAITESRKQERFIEPYKELIKAAPGSGDMWSGTAGWRS